jgi:DnaJ-class molecular chaperone
MLPKTTFSKQTNQSIGRSPINAVNLRREVDKMINIKKVKKLVSKKAPEICRRCGGDGKMVDNSWGSGFSDKIHCTYCNGTGRVLEAELVVTANIPFDYSIDPQ